MYLSTPVAGYPVGCTMKPLLIIPPASARWHAFHDLLGHKEPVWLEDIQKRLVQGVAGSQDAFAVVSNGGQIVANATISKRHDVAVLGHVFTRPAHRGRGHARRVIQTVLSWFDMTGGKWLYLGTTADLADGLFGEFGFKIIRRAPRQPHDGAMMLRSPEEVGYDPLDDLAGSTLTIEDITRADWPMIVALLQHRPGPDPRVSLDESAVSAELTALELLSRQEQGVCHLKAASRGRRVVGMASVATDQLGARTYAMLMPPGNTLPELRDAIIAFAQSKGYTQVDFPMEALGASA